MGRPGADVPGRNAFNPETASQLRAVVVVEAERGASNSGPVVQDVAEAVAPPLRVPCDVGGPHRPGDLVALVDVPRGVLVGGGVAIGPVDPPVELWRGPRGLEPVVVGRRVLRVALDERGDPEAVPRRPLVGEAGQEAVL